MISLQDALKDRIELYKQQPDKVVMEWVGKEYNKNWAKAVKHFQDRINLDMRKEKKSEFEFMPIRMKLIALKEIDDLRWFYGECLKYSYTKNKQTGKRNTFSQCFFGALKIRT